MSSESGAQVCLHLSTVFIKLLSWILFYSVAEVPLQTKRYLNKKKTAEEMEQHFQTTSSVDYSLKEGETLVLQIKNVSPLSLLFAF